MEHHHDGSSTHYLMWKLQSEFPGSSFRAPALFQESLVWPPRSYPCSFCRREFRSAQALGGHMNVHRRDRAKLKQSPPPSDDDVHVVCKRHKLLNSSEEIDLELRLGAPAANLKLGQISSP